MAHTYVELRAGRSGEWGADRLGKYTRQFRVIFDDAAGEGRLYGPIAVRATIPVSIGDTYAIGAGAYAETDTGAYCTKIRAEPESDDGLQWIATCQYEPTEVPEDADPLAQPAEIEWDFAAAEVIADEDRDGDPIVNSAEDPFDPPVMKDVGTPVLRVRANMETFSATVAMDLVAHLNAASFMGAAADHAKVARIRARPAFHEAASTLDHWYWEVEYEIAFKVDSFAVRVLDQGLRQVVSGAHKAIMNNGVPVTSPVLLDGSGAPLSPGDPAEWLEFHVQPQASFADIEDAINR